VIDETTGLPVAIAAVVVHPDGRQLIVRRALTDSAGGYWTPVTGKIDAGESARDAVVRECREEVGLHVSVGAELYRCPTQHAKFMLVWYEALLVGDDVVTAEPTEVAEARWVSPSEAMELTPMFEATREFYGQLARHEGRSC